jgi:hypothetical protein
MPNGILHLHLACALLFGWALLRANALWLRIGAALGAVLLLSGAYNFMTLMKPPVPAGWHAGVGIKLLLGLHAITMAVLLARGGVPTEKMQRWRKGALISFALTLAIGLYFSNLAR